MATTSQTKTSDQLARQKLLCKAAYTELVADNFQIQPKYLIERVPRGMELDDFHGDTYVSLVCMVMRKIGVLGIPISRGFVEMSLRFYVRHPSDPENRKGTCFIKRYVSSPTAAWVLSSRFDTDYNKMKMKSNNSGFQSGGIPQVDFQWIVEDQRWNKLRVKARSRMKNTGPDTKVGFILDHPTQYVSKDRKTLEYKVVRPKWTVWDAAQANFTCDVEKLFGKQFVHALGRRPASVFLTKGSDVSIYRPEQV